MLDYFSPFSFFFKEKGWFGRLLIASLLTCTLVGAAPVFGWSLEITRRVKQGVQPLVPEWQDWKLFWRLGGQFALVNAVWLLPILLLSLLLYLPLLLSGHVPAETVLVTWMASFGCIMLLMLAYSLAYIFIVPAMMVALVETGSVRKAMSPAHLLRCVRPQLTAYTIVFLIVGLGLMNAVLMLAPLTLFLLLPPLLVYVGLVTAHFAGQLAARQGAEGAPPAYQKSSTGGTGL